MRIIKGLDYYHKLETMIDECIEKAQKSPFEDFIFIVEDKEMVEQLFLQRIPYLINIEIMTWSTFLQSLKIQYHYTKHHVISHTELTYYLYQILDTHSFECFHTDNPYPLIEKLLPLIKDMNLSHTLFLASDFQNSPKLVDFINIYQLLIEKCDEYTHLNQEDLFQQCDFKSNQSKHIYIEGDHLYQATRQNIIKRLSSYNDITVLYTYNEDDRLCNLPYTHFCTDAQDFISTTHLTENIFLQSPKKDLENQNLYTFTAATLHYEIKRVIYTILQMIVDQNLRYQDFAIVYPDSTYVDILLKTLNEKNIPHNLPQTSQGIYDYSYQYLLEQIQNIKAAPIYQIIEQLDKEHLDKDYQDYLESLSSFDMVMDSFQFKAFFEATCHINHSEKLNNQDQIKICTIEQLKLAKARHIFFLGLNETILPHFFKDTNMLLNEDILLLRQKGISTPLTTLEQSGLHYNDILKALSQPYLSMTFSYPTSTLSGETRLESSLYKQLTHMYNLKPLPVNHYLSLDDYYLNGGMIDEKNTVNHNIHDYISTKNQPSTIHHQIIEKLYSPTLSVSQIETYNKCPFQYFIQYGLGIYALKEDKLMPNELGSLVHYVLSVNLTDDKDIQTLVTQYIEKDETLLKKIHSSKLNQYFIKQLIIDLKLTLTVLKEFLNISSLTVHSQEEKIEDIIQGMKFKGFVDRIDIYQNYISIIDYKSSAKDIDLNLAMQGFNIQMLLYLKMVTQKYNKDAGSVLYFNTKRRILSSTEIISEIIDKDELMSMYKYGGYIIDDEQHQMINALDPLMERKSNIINVTYLKSKDTYKGHLLTNNQLELLLEEIEKHVYKLYQQMMEGHIAIDPKGSDQSATHALVNPCRYCTYRSVCHFDVFYNDYHLVEFYNIDEKLGGEDDAI